MPNPVMKQRTVAEIKHSFVHGNRSKKTVLKRLKVLAPGESLKSPDNPYGSRRQVVDGWQEERRAALRSA